MLHLFWGFLTTVSCITSHLAARPALLALSQLQLPPAPPSQSPVPPLPHTHNSKHQQHFCPHCPPNKNQFIINIPHHHGNSDHTHVSPASHMTTLYRGGSGYVVSSSPTKNNSLYPSGVQGSGGGGRVSPSPSFVTSYKPGPSLSTKFVDRDCSLSESNFIESCANFNHKPTTLQSNV